MQKIYLVAVRLGYLHSRFATIVINIVLIYPSNMKPKVSENKLEKVIRQLIEEKDEETRALQKILKYISKDDENSGMDNAKK
jgi:hypothetical protein